MVDWWEARNDAWSKHIEKHANIGERWAQAAAQGDWRSVRSEAVPRKHPAFTPHEGGRVS